MREATIHRKTLETDVRLALGLDGSGKTNVQTNCGFLDHMLTLFAAHALFDLEIFAAGDIQVDDHHLVEDVGIVLGSAIAEALGEKKGIRRYGSMLLPMDEALVLCALDLSGRSELVWGLTLPTQKVGTFDTELGEEFFRAVSRSGAMTLHFQQFSGKNSHHILEAAFKAFGHALGEAVSMDPQRAEAVPSTKGVL